MAKAKQKSVAKESIEKADTDEVTTDPQSRTRQHGDQIAEAAYYMAEKRGFVPGYEMQDWLEAEKEISKSDVRH